MIYLGLAITLTIGVLCAVTLAVCVAVMWWPSDRVARTVARSRERLAAWWHRRKDWR